MSFTLLPTEIVSAILDLVTYNNERQARQSRAVNRQWNALINYSEFKIPILLPSDLDLFQQCFINRLEPFGLDIKNWAKINPAQLERVLYNFTILTSLKVNQYLKSQNVETALDLSPLTRLQLLDARTISLKSLLSLSSLTSLQFFKSSADEPVNPTALKTAMQNIRHLQCDSSIVLSAVNPKRVTSLGTHSTLPYDWAEYENLKVSKSNTKHENRHEVIHSTSLEELEIYADELELNCPNLTYLQLLQPSCSIKLSHEHSLTQLKSFYFLDKRQMDLEKFEFLTNLQSLEHLTLVQLAPNRNESVCSYASPHIHLIPTTLTHLRLSQVSHNASVIRTWTHLESLVTIYTPKEDPEALFTLTNLTFLALTLRNYDTLGWSKINELTRLKSLMHLQLFGSPPAETDPIDVSPLTQLTALRQEQEIRIIGVSVLTSLIELQLWSDSANIEHLTRLTRLLTKSFPEKNGIDQQRHSQLVMLEIHSISSQAQLDLVASLTSLTSLVMRDIDLAVDTTALSRLTNLRYLKSPKLDPLNFEAMPYL